MLHAHGCVHVLITCQEKIRTTYHILQEITQRRDESVRSGLNICSVKYKPNFQHRLFKEHMVKGATSAFYTDYARRFWKKVHAFNTLPWYRNTNTLQQNGKHIRLL